MRISTKKGDNGESKLFNGKTLKKSEPIFEILGGLDELNSFLGFCKVVAAKKEKVILEKIQNDIYKIMSLIGNEMKMPKMAKGLSETDLSFLEEKIEKAEKITGILSKFVAPGKSEASARLHIARTACRRAERLVVGQKNKLKITPLILKYLNRLSDLLFLMAEIR